MITAVKSHGCIHKNQHNINYSDQINRSQVLKSTNPCLAAYDRMPKGLYCRRNKPYQRT